MDCSNTEGSGLANVEKALQLTFPVNHANIITSHACVEILLRDLRQAELMYCPTVRHVEHYSQAQTHFLLSHCCTQGFNICSESHGYLYIMKCKIYSMDKKVAAVADSFLQNDADVLF